ARPGARGHEPRRGAHHARDALGSLLPQPHGVEGLVSFREVLLSDDDSPAEHEHLADRLVDGDAGVPRTANYAAERDYPVAEVDDLVVLELDVVPRLVERLPDAAIGRVPPPEPDHVREQRATAVAYD